jgi:beta-aspartyl-peptidase (threonine type)
MTTPNTLGRLVLAGIALGCGLGRLSADTGAPAEAGIRKMLADQEAAWNRGDLEGFMVGYWKSPELTFYSGRDKQQGWQAAYDRYKARYQAPGKEMGRVSFSEVTVEPIAPDAALVRGRWKVQLKADTLDGLFTLIVKKKPEGWRIVHDHTSAGEPPAGKKPDGQ